MQKHLERHVPHSAAQMLALVADVDAYPQFIPHCERMDVRRDVANPNEKFDARMHIRFGPISQAYTSRIVVDPEAKTLRAKAVDGLFSHLDSIWRFTEDGQGTAIVFDIDFKIANPLIRSVAEPAFAAKQDEIMDAFIAEARRRYGA
ncbi:type II toxin-antitoxin system RatA family toxin [Pelagibacterium halotolerans]|uniref:Putative oligoketide cyclase/dehydratase or lipid transport protein YfjG n=1 Tax=Pelagibacterium halotolerans (strain DSM 22347 / JCM 15775 / CGMCC 1.7692 / B2) TaxID=1082931 RepID=G4R8Z5_PELHB|nr:type II toxin-antitoxin system RatA family toxin [Pelagibacterium halotolerans]AEQ51412.1 putative oligoketide cyclase/dehydratase or lipid transport protein YfjG [Pelagibacterium halotolerans B2]QJR18745.1 type II toxin-antitoxin system RatA family toxin [Pelagibacterium halotolerans]SEA12786.1 coenzyme Q-binding protein COQ10 [Pelagibacterium halotolerans]